MLHQIGVGALGPVFRTYEPERDRLVAVKAFRLDITPEQAQTLAEELSRAAEAGLFHPSIVEPIAAGVEGTVAYCAEEYVAAESLDSAMRHYAPAPITTVLPFITQLAGAIDFARAAGVGHGALHPRDVFVTPDEARATGFGVVEALERVGFRAPVRRPYSPPERIAGIAWTTAADVFSLAAITYEMLTARRPAGLGREIGTLTAGTSNAWMDALHAVLARAMDPEPSARFATALAFASALEAAARGETSEATLPMARPFAAPTATPAVTSSPAVDSAATMVSARTVGTAKGTDRTSDTQEEEGDILGEQLDDETDHQLRTSERDDPFHRDPGEPLDEDIEAEAEADRFVGDDFLLDAAGAASAAPAHPYDVRARDLPIDADASDTLLDARALEDDEVAVDDAPSPAFAPQDLLNDETIRRPRADAARYGAIPVAPAAVGYDQTPPSARPPFRGVVLLIAGMAVGLIGGYALWGGGSEAPVTTAGTAANTAATAAPAAPASGREFSEQAVTPPAPAATGERAASSGSAGTPGGPTVDRPRGAESGAAAKPSAAASAGTLVVRSTPSGAGVTLNGRWRGRTPLTLDDLPFRRYEVRVVQPGFAATTETVLLSSDAPARSLSLQLQPQLGRRSLGGGGSAAARPRPAAPPETPAAAPRATARPAAPRDEPQSPTVFTGSIYVDSRPRGARVTVDGKPVGVTPVRVADVRIGTHVVRLELPDHRWWSTTTRVTSGQEQRVTGSLERIQ